MSYGPPPPVPPPPGAQPPPYAYGPSPRTNSKAIWSLVLGLLGAVVCGFFTGVPAVLLGRIARREIDQSSGRQSGTGLATAGIVTGWVGIGLSMLSITLYATGVLELPGG